MTTATTTGQYPSNVCKRLDALAEARDQAKSREQDLVRHRKDLKNDLTELGAGNTKKHLEVSREYVVTLFSIEHVRDRIRSLADKTDETIKNAHQPGMFEEGPLDGIDGSIPDEDGIFAAIREKAEAKKSAAESDEEVGEKE